MAEVAQAYVSLIPSTRGFGKAADAALGGDLAKVGDKQGKAVGSKMSSALGTALKGGAVVAGAGAIALIGTTLAKGFSRLQGIDQARAKLSGLGHDAGSVDKIMNNALASVKGTAFGLDQAATVAASAVASGVKPGAQLEKTLKLVADTATIAGTDMNEMGAIFNKVAAGGVIQGEEIAQLGDRGIPVLQFLAAELGVTAQEAKKMASDGKISFETFQRAMETGLGGAALSSGDTFSGALANVNAALGRIGAGVLGGVFPHLAPMFKDITTALGPVEVGAAKLGDVIGAKLGPVIDRIGPALIKFTSGLDFSNLSAGSGSMSELGDSLGKVGAALAGVDWSSLGSAFASGTADTVSVFAVAIGFAADHVDTLAKYLPALVVAFAAYKTAQAAANVAAIGAIPLQAAQVVSNIALANANRSLAASIAASTAAENVGTAAKARSTVATIASTVASKAAALASRAWAAGQWLLNVALTANPIGLVVAAIALLVAGFIYAWRNSSKFRSILIGSWNAIKTAAVAVFGFLKRIFLTFTPVGQIIQNWGKIKSGASSIFGAIKAFVSRALATVKSIFLNFTPVGQIISNWGKIKSGAVSIFNGIVSFIRGIPGKAASALSGLGSRVVGVITSIDLFGAGVRLIQGLVDGISSKIEGAVSAVANGAKRIKDLWPGSPIKAGPLKSWNNGGAGKRLMALLAAGIEKGAPAAVRAMGSATSMIADVDAAIPGVTYPDGAFQARAAAAIASSSATGTTRYAMTITDWENGIGFIEALADGRIDAADLMAAQTARAGA
jgi:tape measure domain-containing protein